jgi:hypothetical protein
LEVEKREMKTGHFALMAAGLVCAGVLTTPQAKASEWDRLTKITVTQPFEIPGMVLPPGTYTMRLLDEPYRSPDVVVFSDKDDEKVFQIVQAIPAYRVNPTDRTVLTFAERAGNSPQALKDWWYPGSLRGEEFLYPKGKGILTASTAPVAPESATAPIAAAAPLPASRTAQVVAPVLAPSQQAAPAANPQPATQESVEIAQAQPATASEQQAAARAPAELPRTGSEFPLIGLLGMISAGSGLALRSRA